MDYRQGRKLANSARGTAFTIPYTDRMLRLLRGHNRWRGHTGSGSEMGGSRLTFRGATQPLDGLCRLGRCPRSTQPSCRWRADRQSDGDHVGVKSRGMRLCA